MVLFDNKEKQRKRLIDGCSAIRALLELNATININRDYDHCIVVTQAFPTKQRLLDFSESQALQLANNASKEAIAVKKHNKTQWETYFSKVNTLLLEHPFTSAEAKACQIKEKDYFGMASALFWELGIKPDDQEITVIIQIGLIGDPSSQKTFEFNENVLSNAEDITQNTLNELRVEEPEEVIPAHEDQTIHSPEPITPAIEESSPKPTEKQELIQNTDEIVSPMEVPEEEPEDDQDLDEANEEVDQALASTHQEENESFSDFVVVDEAQAQPETKTEQIQGEEVESLEPSNENVNFEGIDQEEDLSLNVSGITPGNILDAVKADPTLQSLYPLFKDDKTMIGLMARELIMAKKNSQ